VDVPCRPLRRILPDTEPSPPSPQRASISPPSNKYSTATPLQVISAAVKDHSPTVRVADLFLLLPSCEVQSEDRGKLQGENLVPPRLRGRPSPVSYSVSNISIAGGYQVSHRLQDALLWNVVREPTVCLMISFLPAYN
jgi:hypothetical protein